MDCGNTGVGAAARGDGSVCGIGAGWDSGMTIDGAVLGGKVGFTVVERGFGGDFIGARASEVAAGGWVGGDFDGVLQLTTTKRVAARSNAFSGLDTWRWENILSNMQ